MQKKLTPNTKSEQAGKLTESEEMRQLINMMCETGETMSTKNYRKNVFLESRLFTRAET